MFGLFSIALLTSVWAIFGRIHWEFHCVLLLFNALLFFLFHNSITAAYRGLRFEFGRLSRPLKLFFAFSAVLITAKSAAAPYILDNESYYIQTVKWLNEYGLVKGAANLHIFLAQTSGWHIAQSAFSFSFLYANFNDLSGYCLLLANLFAVLRLNHYFSGGPKMALIVGLLPVANVFFLQFSGAPAADIPVFALTFMVCFYFADILREPNPAAFNRLAVLVLFALYIKITAIAIALLPLYVLATGFKKYINARIVALGCLVLALFAARNAIASGFPLFPLPENFGFRPDYAIPGSIADFFFTESRPYPFGLTRQQYNAMPVWEIILHWMRLPKLHGFFNTTGIVLAAISPAFILRFANTRTMWLLYLAMITQLALLLYLSPQYRFFVNFILFFGLFCTACLISNRKIILGMLAVSGLVASVFVFVPMRLDAVTQNKHANFSTAFSISNIVYPHPNSRSDTGFEKLRNGNLEYYSPVNNDFFWKTGNGPLPCVNKEQLEFFEKRFGVRPQLRGKTLGEGFRSEGKPSY